jgi:hypothetical protein
MKSHICKNGVLRSFPTCYCGACQGAGIDCDPAAVPIVQEHIHPTLTYLEICRQLADARQTPAVNGSNKGPA